AERSMRANGRATFSLIPGLPNVSIIGASDSHVQYIAMTLAQESQKTVLVLPNFKEVSLWANFFSYHEASFAHLGVTAAILPFWSLWGADRFVNHSLTKKQRIHALSLLACASKKCVIITTLQGLGQNTFSSETFSREAISLSVGQDVDQDGLISHLENSGYRFSTIVDEEGLYSARGSILDVYAPSELQPFRIEFLGEKIHSIRQFEVNDQKSRISLDQLQILPASECFVLPAQKKSLTQKLYDYLLSLAKVPAHDRDGLMDSYLRNAKSSSLDVLAPILRQENFPSISFGNNKLALLFPKGLETCIQSYTEMQGELSKAWKHDLTAGRITVDPAEHFTSIENLISLVRSQNSSTEIGPSASRTSTSEIVIPPNKNFEGVSSHLSQVAKFDQWAHAIQNLVQLDNATVVIFASSTEHEERIANLLSHRGIVCVRKPFAIFDYLGIQKSAPSPNGSVTITNGDLADWIWLDDDKTLLLAEHELFGVIKRKVRSSSSKLKNYLSSFKDLKVGDLVVHTAHGIGRYLGMTTMTVSNIRGDFLNLEYAGGDKIYLPIDKLNLLQRYTFGGDGESTTALDRLGGSNWERRRSKVKQAVKDMADQLLKLQAQRAISHAHIYSKPNDDYFKFESEFPYDETEDQLKSIQDINTDLESPIAMDRLICGDVGFGKTEVALRAAFRVVQEGLQVLVLVPTTILCYQHFRTFSDRLGRHGVRVAQLNRFVPGKTAKANMEELASGRIDVLVGTHKILNENLKVRRLGLLIVDEEQKFGVIHKERLKELKAGADILTLTATPIPRTMHMAMLGLRDISIIATPPHNRLSVKTFVAKYDEVLIRDAIEHEIARGGQVFFVHNKVEDIREVTLLIKGLVPKANVRFAHGQMKETELEGAIIDFIEQKFEVLVCTTIIESGVDMPNVNTLIVNDSDRFGLAQLYQMRGRVGRASFQAYAYFLTKDPGRLSDDARRRLDVLSAHQELGAGFQIASHDLEIRGAGSLLGSDQSGHTSEVGLEMYTDLLAEAISELRGNTPQAAKFDTEIRLPVSALLSSSYVPGEGERLHLYKALFSVESLEEITLLEREVYDRFGPVTDEAKRLFSIAKIKFILSQAGAQLLTVNVKSGFFEVKFGALDEKQVDKIIQFVRRSQGMYRLSPDYRLFVYWDEQKFATSLIAATEGAMLTNLLDMLSPIAIELGLL
ncbi:MAG: transcription-repair coupling factor, partial [Proteobacteria bacterium]|nr:transcription-repair coupling factor [Pseudomonadota bacterium]